MHTRWTCSLPSTNTLKMSHPIILHPRSVYNAIKRQCYTTAKLHFGHFLYFDGHIEEEVEKNLRLGDTSCNINNRPSPLIHNIFAVPYRFMESRAVLFIEPPIIENNSSSLHQPFALSLFWQSGETLCGEVLEGGAGGRLHQAAM